MSEIGILTPEQSRLLWQDFLKRAQLQPDATQNLRPRRPVYGVTDTRCVILDAELVAADDARTGGNSVLATICEWDPVSEEYAESTRQLTVWNHSESTTHAVDTFGIARWIDNHWWFFGDCEAMSSR